MATVFCSGMKIVLYGGIYVKSIKDTPKFEVSF